MEPITNVDAIVTLLRRRLVERSRREEVSRSRRTARHPASRSDGVATVRALAAIAGVSDQELGRTFVQSILTEQFGDGLLNDSKFQQVIDHVSRALTDDPQTSVVFRRVLDDLRAVAAR